MLLFALWWLYFRLPAGHGLLSRREASCLWGYGHYGVFAGLAALGAGLEVAVEQSGHRLAASPLARSGTPWPVPTAGMVDGPAAADPRAHRPGVRECGRARCWPPWRPSCCCHWPHRTSA
ncbi:low temperature requirement protein A [Yinghuangia aomiensis]